MQGLGGFFMVTISGKKMHWVVREEAFPYPAGLPWGGWDPPLTGWELCECSAAFHAEWCRCLLHLPLSLAPFVAVLTR